jgi:hypothetical protein
VRPAPAGNKKVQGYYHEKEMMVLMVREFDRCAHVFIRRDSPLHKMGRVI